MFLSLVRNFNHLLFGYHTLPALPEIKRTPLVYKDILYLMSYRDEAVQILIKANKYYRNQTAAKQLGQLLCGPLQSYQTNTPLHIVPVPQSYQRWRERGFDHLLDIVTATPGTFQVETRALKKITHTERQAHVLKSQRLTQQVGTFSCQSAIAKKLHGTVILFDDVVTTGATMHAAKRALLPHLPRDTRLICLALAH